MSIASVWIFSSWSSKLLFLHNLGAKINPIIKMFLRICGINTAGLGQLSFEGCRELALASPKPSWLWLSDTSVEFFERQHTMSKSCNMTGEAIRVCYILKGVRHNVSLKRSCLHVMARRRSWYTISWVSLIRGMNETGERVYVQAGHIWWIDCEINTMLEGLGRTCSMSEC